MAVTSLTWLFFDNSIYEGTKGARWWEEGLIMNVTKLLENMLK